MGPNGALPSGYDVIDAVRCRLCRASGIARGTDGGAFTGVDDPEILSKARAKRACESKAEDSTFEAVAKLALDTRRDSFAQRVFPSVLREIALKVLLGNITLKDY